MALPTEPGPESVLATTSRGEVEYADVGGGTPVLVVHGTPGGWDQAVALGRIVAEAGFRVLAPSRPGYGRTPLVSGTTPAEQADLLAALLDRLEIEAVGVLCWSGGGPAAYRFAVQHPDRVRGLVALAAVSHSFELRAEKPADRLMMGTAVGHKVLELMARGTPDQLIAATIAAEGHLTKSELKERTAEVVADDRRRAFVLTLALTANRSGPRRAGYENDSTELAGIGSLELERVSAPTLLVHGLADSDVPPEHSRSAARAIPQAELVEIPGGTHLAFHINPAAPTARAYDVLRGRI